MRLNLQEQELVAMTLNTAMECLKQTCYCQHSIDRRCLAKASSKFKDGAKLEKELVKCWGT